MEKKRKKLAKSLKQHLKQDRTQAQRAAKKQRAAQCLLGPREDAQRPKEEQPVEEAESYYLENIFKESEGVSIQGSYCSARDLGAIGASSLAAPTLEVVAPALMLLSIRRLLINHRNSRPAIRQPIKAEL